MRFVLVALLTLAPLAHAADEPNVKTATEWWPQLTNVVTPVAWRDHPHRFIVLFDGTILALPQPQKLLRHPWDRGEPLEGVQITLRPTADGDVPTTAPAEQHPLALPNGKRVGDQGWTDRATPVLWTRWGEDNGTPAGIAIRQSVFASMKGGGEARSGEEAMFLWIRLEVIERELSKATAERCGFIVTLNAPHMRFEMSESDNCRVMPAASAYAKPLRFDGRAVIEGDDLLRLVVSSDSASQPVFSSVDRDHFLHITFPATPGSPVDLLLPMVPATRESIEQELKLGFDGALDRADRFWSDRPSTAATIHTPEPLINAAISNGVRIARMLSTTVPKTKQKSLLSGAVFYSYLWTTPTAMTKHMLLDPLGWHGEVEKYLEVYRTEQGRTKAPGPAFPPHPGYFGAPAALDSGNHWLSDHGSVLYTSSRHALLTGDEQFIARWLEPILQACDFIKTARQLPRKGPFAPPGVMPPASSTDISRPIQALTSDGFSYKALVTAARLLRVIDHPRAREFEDDAADYREAICQALAAKAARQPRWTDRFGRSRPIVPMTLTTDDTDGLGHEHPFYLDAGPTFAVYAGILRADDELMRDAIAFLREGPHVREADPAEVHWRSPPRLVQEMSSAEPCYSWNIYHSHQLGDRARFLEGMYSIVTGALSRQTSVSCETRGGITENVFASALAVDLARLSTVDDTLEPGNLHLMRLTPLAWISASEQTRFENMPTEFGPVTLKWQLASDGRTLNVEYAPNFRRAPGSVLLHVPPLTAMKNVIVNGTEHAADGGKPIQLVR